MKKNISKISEIDLIQFWTSFWSKKFLWSLLENYEKLELNDKWGLVESGGWINPSRQLNMILNQVPDALTG